MVYFQQCTLQKIHWKKTDSGIWTLFTNSLRSSCKANFINNIFFKKEFCKGLLLLLSERNTKQLIKHKKSIKKNKCKNYFLRNTAICNHIILFVEFIWLQNRMFTRASHWLFCMLQPYETSSLSITIESCTILLQHHSVSPSLFKNRILDRSFNISVRSFFKISYHVSFHQNPRHF